MFASATPPTSVRLDSFRLPSYAKEEMIVRAGDPFRIELRGRLDLLVAGMLTKALNSLPQPCRVLVDLRKSDDVREPALASFLEAAAAGDGLARCRVVANPDQTASSTRGAELLHPDVESALAALGRFSGIVSQPLMVDVVSPMTR